MCVKISDISCVHNMTLMYAWLRACLCVRVYVCVYLCIHIIYVCMYVYAYVCMCASNCICMCMHNINKIIILYYDKMFHCDDYFFF